MLRHKGIRLSNLNEIEEVVPGTDIEDCDDDERERNTSTISATSVGSDVSFVNPLMRCVKTYNKIFKKSFQLDFSSLMLIN